jgi:hypothetical protein
MSSKGYFQSKITLRRNIAAAVKWAKKSSYTLPEFSGITKAMNPQQQDDGSKDADHEKRICGCPVVGLTSLVSEKSSSGDK